MRRLDLTGRTDIPVPEPVLAEVSSRSARTGVEIMVIGAAARDLVVHAPVGSAVTRATADVDIAVAVADESELGAFSRGLQRVPGTEHAFIVRGVKVDVVPFGVVEHRRQVRFGDGQLLDVTGLAEAAVNPVQVCLPGGTQVSVASLPAQAVLKVLAWRDRRHDNSKDARDLTEILRASSEGPYGDETWHDDEALLATDHDIIAAGPFRAGRLAARPFDGSGAAAVLAVLTSQPLRSALLRDMGAAYARDLLDGFTAGFQRGAN